MTAPLYLLPEGRLDAVAPGDAVLLDGAEGHHAATVKRAGVGTELMLADGAGRGVRGVVEDVRGEALTVRVSARVGEERPGPSFVLAQALAKGGRDEQALEAATELGVDAVLAWQARRSVAVWRGDRGRRHLEKWRTLARAASKQSRRLRVPAVDGPLDTPRLADRLREADLALVLHEDATIPLAGLALPTDGEVVLVVGPEGGIAADELRGFQAAGAVSVRLGPTVLRSSSAGPAALAVLNAAERWR